MIKQRNMRFLTIALTTCFVLIAGSVAAKGGKDDKNKGKDKTEGNTVAQDSIDILDVDGDIIQVDDTLVFEDWENPNDPGGDAGDDGFNIKGDDPIDDELKGRPGMKTNGYNQVNDVKLGELKNLLKKDYTVEFQIYPNPTVDVLHIRSETVPSEVRICDLSGRQHKVLNYTTSVSVSDLPTGTYFIQLVYYDHVESRKFIKR